MTKRVYEFIKSFITENYLILLLYLVVYITLTYPLPYCIYTSGGLIDVNEKINMINKTESVGSYNMCYVTELRATIPTYIMSFFNKDWEVISNKDIVLDEKETNNDVNNRDRIYLNDANNNAVLNAFKLANLDYDIKTSNPIIIYIHKDSNTNLKIGDELIKINGNTITKADEIDDYVNNSNIGDKLDITVRNNNKIYNRYAYIVSISNEKKIGIGSIDNEKIETDPKINFRFKKTETGPSGGLIVTLALYDYLIDEDITKGLKISGTGTIDKDGNIGEIGGVKFKLKGAVKAKSNIFFVPSNNYKEAISYKKKKHYNIEIVKVNTINDAINYLKNIK